MEIEVRLFNEFERYQKGAGNIFPVELDPGSRVNSLLVKLRIPLDTERVLLVNGRRADEQTVLHPRDTVVVFSPVAGG